MAATDTIPDPAAAPEDEAVTQTKAAKAAWKKYADSGFLHVPDGWEVNWTWPDKIRRSDAT